MLYIKATFMNSSRIPTSMCYSKEVQLITSLVLILSAIGYYLYYSRKYQHLKERWVLSFLNLSTIIFLLIGFHQFFEFLSLLTNNLLIYKIGLIISVCAVYFLLRSLEVLSNRKVHSWIALILIAITAIHILISTLDFTAASFYVKHNSTFFWAATWLFLFIYWHTCAFNLYPHLDSPSKKTLIIYLLTIADVSFLLSAAYVLAGHFFFSVNVCTDAPSIWCTFYVLQSLLIPFLFYRLPQYFSRRSTEKIFSFKETVILLIISFFILSILVATLPLFNCLTWKFIFP